MTLSEVIRTLSVFAITFTALPLLIGMRWRNAALAFVTASSASLLIKWLSDTERAEWAYTVGFLAVALIFARVRDARRRAAPGG